MSETYPKDDFDEVPQDSPVGVHRRTRSRWAPVLPFLIILIVVPLLAWGVATLIQRNVPKEELLEVVGQSEVTQSDGVTIDEEVVEEVVVPPSEVPTAAPDDPNEAAHDNSSGPDSPETGGNVNHATPVAVLNGTGVAGYAGEIAAQVMNAGFTDVRADNANSWPTDQNTVFYANADQQATAQSLAASLGIANVAEGGFTEAPGQIVVFLAN